MKMYNNLLIILSFNWITAIFIFNEFKLGFYMCTDIKYFFLYLYILIIQYSVILLLNVK